MRQHELPGTHAENFGVIAVAATAGRWQRRGRLDGAGVVLRLRGDGSDLGIVFTRVRRSLFWNLSARGASARHQRAPLAAVADSGDPGAASGAFSDELRAGHAAEARASIRPADLHP